MRLLQTTAHTRKQFAVLHATRSSQTAMMTLPPGGESNEASANVRAGRTRLVTLNIYVPPAYDKDGDPLR
jgi:hypothetical protein